MGCIDLFVPGGQLLSIPFMLEQIWITGYRNELRSTEVYDFLLVSDEAPVDKLMLLLPHFCRSQDRSGQWHDHIRVLAPGGKRTGWGWFYSTDESDGGTIRLTVADPMEPRGPQTVRLKGKRLSKPRVHWHPDLQTEDRLDLMRSTRKSFYVLSLGEQLGGGGASSCWLRLIVQPQQLSLPGEIVRLRGPSGLFRTVRKADALVACPAVVRRWFMEACDEYAEHHEGDVAHTAVTDLIVRDGFVNEETGLRILDHRLILVAYDGLEIEPRQVPPTIVYQGTQDVSGDWTHAPTAAPLRWPQDRVSGRAHFFSGGSRAQANRDLLCIAQAIIDQAGYKRPKTPEELASLVCPEHHWEAIELIGRMQGLGLLKATGKGGARLGQGDNDLKHEKLCELRHMYSNAFQFRDFPEARTVYRVLHPFRIDFSAQWGRMGVWQLVLLWVFALAGLVALATQLAAALL